MAKKAPSIGGGSMSKFLEKLDKFDPKGSVIDEYAAISDSNTIFINTGSYIVNAHFSGSILKGVPMGKIVTVCGDPKAGKSFMLLNICREAQLAGYYPVYIETEHSHEKKRFQLQGIDVKNARITQPQTVEDLIKIVNPLIASAMEIYDAAMRISDEKKKAEKLAEIPKICFFLDSRSGLLSKQQLESFAEGDPKANMGTDIQTYDNFMKSIAVNLGKLGWGFVVAAHTKIEELKIQGRSATKRRPKGGFGQVFMSSVVSMMWKKDERDEDDKSIITGIRVSMDIYESRYVKHGLPISFLLPNDRPMSPFDGMMDYVTWDICRIGKGKWVEVVDVLTKLITKKVIAADAKAITQDNLDQLSKADSEFMTETIAFLIEKGYLMSASGELVIQKKYRERDAATPLGVVPINNPNSPKFIAAHLPGEQFTWDEIVSNVDDKIFTQQVLEMIDKHVRADFEIGERSLSDLENGEEDFFK